MDGLMDDAAVELSNDDMALLVGRLMLDNVALRNEIVRLRQMIADTLPKVVMTE